MSLDRRGFLGAATLLAAPTMLFARAATELRFVFIVQRRRNDCTSQAPGTPSTIGIPTTTSLQEIQNNLRYRE